jgi:hypothetical protein
VYSDGRSGIAQGNEKGQSLDVIPVEVREEQLYRLFRQVGGETMSREDDARPRIENQAAPVSADLDA